MTENNTSTTLFRVRYSETDAMGTYYNSRALEWFEIGRTDWLRQTGVPYTEMESRGVMLPLVTAHADFLGRARYDDELKMTVTARMDGRVCVRFDITIAHAADDAPVCTGYTVHAIVDPAGKPIRPPQWFTDLFARP